jgi:Putative restriction endonuclease
MSAPSDKGLPMQTAQHVQDDEYRVVPDISAVVIEDDTPVDNIFTEKQEGLLKGPLYASWSGPPPEDDQIPRTFEVFANVGLFISPHEKAIVPDVMLSVDVKVHEDLSKKEHRSYFIWEFRKAPEVVIEIVSNREGGELGDKMRRYRRMGIKYYVVFDPLHQLGKTALRSYELRGDLYIPLEKHYYEPVGLGLVEWEGVHEDHSATWIRWCTKDGQLIPTAEETAAQERLRADIANKRADDERKRADLLAAKLRALGVDPDAA